MPRRMVSAGAGLLLVVAGAWLMYRGADDLARLGAYEREVAGLQATGGDDEVEVMRWRSGERLALGFLCIAVGGVLGAAASRSRRTGEVAAAV